MNYADPRSAVLGELQLACKRGRSELMAATRASTKAAEMAAEAEQSRRSAQLTYESLRDHTLAQFPDAPLEDATGDQWLLAEDTRLIRERS